MKFNYIVGLDQTGAINSKGEPKPLFATLVCVKTEKTFINERLKNLNYESFDEIFKKNKLSLKDKKVLVLIDSVFGLPATLGVKPEHLLSKVKSFEHKKKKYGLETAHQFFCSFLKPQQQHPTRSCENLVKANSLFKKHPFQKNISCGTYRVLKQLALSNLNYKLWPFHELTSETQFCFAESYPSYIWKTLYKLPSRQVKKLEALTSKKFLTADDADSFVLAQMGLTLIKNKQLKSSLNVSFSKPIQKFEGWILGVPYEC